MKEQPILTPTQARAVERVRSGERSWRDIPLMTRIYLPIFEDEVNKPFRRLTYGKVERDEHRTHRVYPVLLDGDVIGYVEGWEERGHRDIPGTRLISHHTRDTTHWRASLTNGPWWGDNTIGYQHSTRDLAARAILGHLKEKGKL